MGESPGCECGRYERISLFPAFFCHFAFPNLFLCCWVQGRSWGRGHLGLMATRPGGTWVQTPAPLLPAGSCFVGGGELGNPGPWWQLCLRSREPRCVFSLARQNRFLPNISFFLTCIGYCWVSVVLMQEDMGIIPRERLPWALKGKRTFCWLFGATQCCHSFWPLVGKQLNLKLFGGGNFSPKPAGAGCSPKQVAELAAVWPCGPLHHPLCGV